MKDAFNQFLALEEIWKAMETTSPAFKDVDAKYQEALAQIKVPVSDFFDIVMIVSYLSFLPLFYGF